MYKSAVIVSLCVAVLVAIVVLFQFANLTSEGKTSKLENRPPMGWNSWNYFGKRSINEKIVKEIMDAMVSSGLKTAGYQYVVIDGGWRDSRLSSRGELLPHPRRFPGGIKPLADYAHARGLKFGLHTAVGTHDCGGEKVGGFGHEAVQVRQFASWGVDFIKLDLCRMRGWNEGLIKNTYAKWHSLFANSGQNIVLSISAYSFRDWYPSVSQIARTTGDIGSRKNRGARFEKSSRAVMAIASINNKWAAHAGYGYWNDPDMLVIGSHGLSFEEQKTHFALWCIMTAPMMLGNDPRHMTEEERDLLLNEEAIAVDQDPTEQGRRVAVDGDIEIWAKRLTENRTAVLAINRHGTEVREAQLVWNDLDLRAPRQVRDILGKKDLGIVAVSISKQILPHSSWFLLLSPVNS